ncbi:carboxypeptidase-like regulatory domain-containing protein [Mucilaginibacter sp. UR6-11]|uniref:carboxypeptidase-like regulatory domain-containing protein n=1 Tax=Mucilaginibacter sp. UR6-11 TaxID=1435644 RepID=UPI001E612AA2|nr:carboxypeptidase-like regulatory domain-containing protein [Mucilaginibacter sp. UR6-11]MCC8425780.1 carboxypeptidase-like regulatory domain-containing protein [Mucilaginibacter sp. UR6-11]
MRLKNLIVLTVLIYNGLSAYSQTRLNGKVISATDKQPISNVSISLQGKDIGTVTNEEGRFTLVARLTPADSLAIDYLGYKSQKIGLNNIRLSQELVIQLDTLIRQLKEVAVKPLTLRQLLDSITIHNQKAFLTPMKLNGYYREFVFTNNKCTEYADALTTYFRSTNKLSDDGQLKIIASRCAEAKEDNKDKSAAKEFYLDSKVPPNRLFEYAMLYGMIDKYFPVEDLKYYNYTMESVQNSTDLVVIVSPKPAAADKIHRVTFHLTDDFTLQSYRLEIDPTRMQNLPSRSLLGIHVKVLKRYAEVNYERSGNKIYPRFFKFDVMVHIGGKFSGTTLDQTYNPRSEYVTTDISTTNLTPFARSEVYKKGNLCNNGVAINDALLKEHNFITPSTKDSLAISSMR